jgi:hypothetical protein
MEGQFDSLRSLTVIRLGCLIDSAKPIQEKKQNGLP